MESLNGNTVTLWEEAARGLKREIRRSWLAYGCTTTMFVLTWVCQGT